MTSSSWSWVPPPPQWDFWEVNVIGALEEMWYFEGQLNKIPPLRRQSWR
jgi:hypothetical protein